MPAGSQGPECRQRASRHLEFSGLPGAGRFFPGFGISYPADLPLTQLAQRPASGGAQAFVCLCNPLPQLVREAPLTAVAHGNGDVAPQAAKPRAAYRRSVELLLESLFVE